MNDTNASNVRHPMSRMLMNRVKGPMRAPARALGFFSIGLGLAELILPRTMARIAGAPNVALVTRFYGLREIAVGIGLLTSENPAPWLWGRVAGDALDIATVSAGLATSGRPARTLMSLATLGGIAYVDYQVAQAAVPKRLASGGASFDYASRSGFPKPASEMRGAALEAKEAAAA